MKSTLCPKDVQEKNFASANAQANYFQHLTYLILHDTVFRLEVISELLCLCHEGYRF